MVQSALAHPTSQLCELLFKPVRLAVSPIRDYMHMLKQMGAMTTMG